MPSSLALDRLGQHAEQTLTTAQAAGPGWQTSVPVLAEELAALTDPRRAAGRRFDLVFLLGVVTLSVLTGIRTISGIRRWTTGAPPAVLTALARGGPTHLPAATTGVPAPGPPRRRHPRRHPRPLHRRRPGRRRPTPANHRTRPRRGQLAARRARPRRRRQ